MSARLRCQIAIHNDTDQPLRRTRLELPHGQWTRPWHPPERIAPGERVEFRSEGALIAGIPSKGTEGRIAFQIGDDPGAQLYVHWNVPHLESQYGNTYHVFGPAGYEPAFSGGHERPRARLDVRLRPTARRFVPGFSPAQNGFAFRNVWPAHLPVMTVGELYGELERALPLALRPALLPAGIVLPFAGSTKVTDGGDGLCGGMVFAVMDYWNADQTPGARAQPPDQPDDPVFRYVRQRLVDSFDFSGRGHRWIAYSSPHYPDGDSEQGLYQSVLGLSKGRAWVTYREEWPRIRSDITEGRLSPIGLVQTRDLDIGRNHQVLAYAYEQSGQHVTLSIYDPNYPGIPVTLGFDITRTDGRVKVERSSGDEAVTCIFRMDGYTSQPPVEGRLGGRQPRRGSLRHLLETHTGVPSGSLVRAVPGHRRPISARRLL